MRKWENEVLVFETPGLSGIRTQDLCDTAEVKGSNPVQAWILYKALISQLL